MEQIIRNMSDLKKHVDIACSKAVKSASDILLEKLQEYIQEDYYKMYKPIYYSRTMKFFESAIAHMIDKTSAIIGIDDLYMSYQYPAKYTNPDGSSGHWTGEDQAYMADAGFHGNVNIYRDGHYWKDFQKYCEEHVLDILAQELRKQGLNIQKI